MFFYDYPRHVPIVPDQDTSSHVYARLTMWIAIATATCIPVAVLAMLLTRSSLFFVLILLVGTAAAASIVAINRQAKIARFEHEFPRLEEYKKCLYEAKESYEGYQRNYDKVEAQLRSRLVAEELAFNEYRDAEMRKIDEMRDATQAIADHYLTEMVKWCSKQMTPNNFATQKNRLTNAIEICRRKGANVPPDREKQYEQQLRREFEDVLRKEASKAEQRRIKEKIRDEQKAEREMRRAMEDAESQRVAIQRALAQAMARAKDEHSAEIELLQQKLREAEERSQRALSMAQQTKAGHVYVISNIGSFGDGIFKVGMTRRLEPLDRVRELGDASVPFPFDVHMMISCDDAPALENSLHRELHRRRINKVNLRKEYFRTTIDDLVAMVEKHHGIVEYVAEPEALEYNESLNMDHAEQDYLEKVMSTFEGEDDDE
ncbi:MAG: GIY-YIG nuclease family protein [Pirellulaceae bacterium]|nr:GIY-YIG nuclease family protein [Planctomycetales bacterium]